MQAQNLPAPLRSDQNTPCSNIMLVLCGQVGAPAEEDLSNWGHHPDVSTLPDDIMKEVAGEDVTFVFSCQVRPQLHGSSHLIILV